MGKLAVLVVLAVSGSILAQPSSGQTMEAARPSWSRYKNERLGTQVDVPETLFEVMRPSSQNGDGQVFTSRDGSVELRVSVTSLSGSAPGSFDSYRRIVARTEPSMSYRAGGRGWFVFSGRARGEIRYTKVVNGCGSAHAVFIRYPASQKRALDPIVTRISSSLTVRCPGH